MLFDSANLPYWIFLLLGIVLFVLVILGGGGDEEMDLDGEFDLDGDFSPAQLLGWLGFGRAPLFLLLATDFSLWGVVGWILNVVVGNITGSIPDRFWGLGGILFIVSLVVSLAIGRPIARLLGQAFASFSEDTSADRLIGCVGTVNSASIEIDRIGQVDAVDSQGNRVTVSAMLPEWATVVPERGAEVMIIDRQPEAYLAIANCAPDRDRWWSSASSSQKRQR